MFKKTNSASGAWGKPLLWGVLCGAVCTLLLLLAAAWTCVATDVPAGYIAPIAFLTVAVGAAVGGIVCGKLARKKGWLFGLLCGTCLFLLLSIIGFACVGKTVGWHALVSLAICLSCGTVGGIIGVNLRSRGFSV